MAEQEKMKILLQVMTCVGKHAMPLENIVEDTGFSIDETLRLLLEAICKGYPIRVTCNGEYYLKNPVENNTEQITCN